MDKVQAQQALWQKLSAGWKKWERPLLDSRQPLHDFMVGLAELKSGNRSLDLATGVGEPGLTAARLHPQCSVVGVDVSDEMLAIARDRIQRHGIQNFELTRTDSVRLPFEERSFDAVFCCFGLEFIPDTAVVLGEVKRILKPAGKLIVNVWGPEDRNPFIEVSAQATRKFLRDQTVTPLSKWGDEAELKKILTQAGFSPVLRPFAGSFQFESPEQLWNLKLDTAVPLRKAWDAASVSEREKLRLLFLSEVQPFENKKHQIVMPYLTHVAVATPNGGANP